MTNNPTTLERAYQLARSGECANLGEIKARLKAAHFLDVDGQLYGRTVTAALRKLCNVAREASEKA